ILLEEPRHRAVDAKDGFIVFTVDVGKRNASEWRDGQLEEIESIVGFVACSEEGNAHLADANRLVHSTTSRMTIMILETAVVIQAVLRCRGSQGGRGFRRGRLRLWRREEASGGCPAE